MNFRFSKSYKQKAKDKKKEPDIQTPSTCMGN